MPEKIMRDDERDFPSLCFTPDEVDLLCCALDRLSFRAEIDVLVTSTKIENERATGLRFHCLLTQQKLLAGDELRITDPETLFIFRSLRNWYEDFSSITGTVSGLSETYGTSQETQAWVEAAGHLIELMSV